MDLTGSVTSPFGGLPIPVPVPDSATVQAAVATIGARDPAFNLDAFLAEAQQAFWLVGRAYVECKPELCQTVLSPSLAAREQAAVQAACQADTHNAPSDEDASSGQLVSINADANGDTAIVHFTSTWKPVSGRDAKPSGHAAKGERRVQNWCFQRPASSRTVQTHEGQHCENCGALLTASAGTCRYCGAAIGAGSGWQVIRIDDVGAEEAAEAATAMRSIITQLAAARQASQPQATAPASTGPRRRSRSGCGPILLFIVLVVAALAIDAVGGHDAFHRTVAKVFPSVRHAELSGPLDLSGQVIAQQATATQTTRRFQVGGTCAKEASRSAWYFTAKLPDSSRFTLQIGLPPGQGGPGTYQRPKVSVSADAQNASRFTSWTSTSAGAVTLVVHSDGGGDLHFSGLPAGQSGGSALSGHLIWTCAMT